MITSTDTENTFKKIQHLFMKKSIQQTNRKELHQTDKGYLYKSIATIILDGERLNVSL